MKTYFGMGQKYKKRSQGLVVVVIAVVVIIVVIVALVIARKPEPLRTDRTSGDK